MSDRREWTGRVFIGASLDGYIARPDGNIDWLTDPPPGPRHASITSSTDAEGWETFFPSVDHLVMGRGTYQKVLTFPTWPYDGKRVIVMSSTLRINDDRVTVVRNLEEALHELAANRSQPGLRRWRPGHPDLPSRWPDRRDHHRMGARPHRCWPPTVRLAGQRRAAVPGRQQRQRRRHGACHLPRSPAGPDPTY